ncbi:hypothetical protein [Micromonospora sp. NPDC051141]|uniref:hypothetical protein n=1 Tax=Micromonospora sp. NPDC051141 TaxID=3364284 RepID=UPI0037A2CCAB
MPSWAVGPYLAARFPVPLMVVAALPGVAAGLAHGGVPPATLAACAAGTMLLFLAQRLVDDIDDFDRDRAQGRLPARVSRAGMVAGLVLSGALALLLGLPGPAAVLTAAVALAGMWVGPLVARHRALRRPVLLFVLYESVPLAIMVFPSARVAADAPVAWGAGLTVGLVLWCAYEFWKFSRKPGDAGYTPFDLTPEGRVRAAAVIAALGAAVAAVAGRTGLLNAPVSVATATVAGLFCLAAAHQAGIRDRRGLPPRWWPGLPLLVILPAVVAVTAAATA